MPPLPFLENQVDPDIHLHFEWMAFRDLSTDRQLGMGMGPIPWTAIDRYATRYGIDGSDGFERFCHLMRAMDDAYCEHIESLKPKTETKTK